MGTSIDSAAKFQSSYDRDLDELLGPSDYPGSNLEVALAHANAGRPVFPCRPDKTPMVNWRNAATRDPGQIRSWWSQYPDTMPAIPMGRASGLAVLDLDIRPDKDGIAALRDLGLDPDTLSPCIVTTPSGGRHLYFRWHDGLGNSAGHLPAGVDARGEGGYVIAPGAIAEAGGYSPENPLPDDLPAWPEALRRDTTVPVTDGLAELLGVDDKPSSPWCPDHVRSALAFIPADLPHEDGWRQVGMALHHGSGGSDDGFLIWYEWSQTAPDAAEDMNRRGERVWRAKWKSFALLPNDGRAPITIGTLYAMANDRGWCWGITDDDFDDLPDDGQLPAEIAAEKVGLIRARNGDMKPTLHNAILFLRKVNRDQGYSIRKNDMTGQDEWRAGPINDADLGLIRVAIEQAGMHNVGADLTAGAVRAVAELNRYHPVKDWLESLHHDGKPRLDTWLTRYLGVEDSPYVRAVGRAFLVAMVARVMRPGCKHDQVLVLGGAQGIGKSTACRILGSDWAGDNMPSIRDGAREAGLYLRGHWLVELAELAPSRKAEQEDLKAFLTRATDEIRAPYARRADIVPRQCVFVGTTNETAFLRDASGGRRFWPVTCGAKIGTEALATDREQLFAEAVSAFRAGEAWHLPPELERQAAIEQEAAREEHPWEQPIREFLDGPTENPIDPKTRDRVTVAEVLRHLGVPTERQTSANARQVAGILRMFGWSRGHTRTGKAWVRS